MRQAASQREAEPADALTDASTPSFGVLQFDPVVTSVDAIQRAAYRLSDRLSIDIQVGEALTVVLHLCGADDSVDIATEFRNEVLDQTLRERIRVESEAARNLILALAFSDTGLIPDE